MKLSTYFAKRKDIPQARFARAIGAHQSDVCAWASGARPVPAWRCVAIEQATNGQVTRRDLRPHDWMRIWPELAKEGSNG